MLAGPSSPFSWRALVFSSLACSACYSAIDSLAAVWSLWLIFQAGAARQRLCVSVGLTHPQSPPSPLLFKSTFSSSGGSRRGANTYSVHLSSMEHLYTLKCLFLPKHDQTWLRWALWVAWPTSEIPNLFLFIYFQFLVGRFSVPPGPKWHERIMSVRV